MVRFENTQRVAVPPRGRKVGSRPLNRTSKTLKQIGRSSRRAHRVALPSARSRKTGLDFARPRQIWTTSFRKKRRKKIETSADRTSRDLCRDFQMGSEFKKTTRKYESSDLARLVVLAAQAAAGGDDVFLALLVPLSANRAPMSPLHGKMVLSCSVPPAVPNSAQCCWF